MLLPALSKAREKARRINCTSNLKQLGTAYALYLDENQGYFCYNTNTTNDGKPLNPLYGLPATNGGYLGAYLPTQKGVTGYVIIGGITQYNGAIHRNGMACPTSVPPTVTTNGSYYRYAQNKQLTNNAIYGSTKVGSYAQDNPCKITSVVGSVSALSVMAEVTSNSVSDNYYDLRQQNLDFRHEDGCNFLFADWHVEFYKKSQVPTKNDITTPYKAFYLPYNE